MPTSRRSAQQSARALYAYVRAGRLHRLKRELYALRPAAGSVDQEPVVSLLQVAARMTPDAVLAYHTALECYGLAYNVWFHVLYAARKPARPLRLTTGLVRGATFARALQQAGREHQETTLTPKNGLRITTVERTLVDIADRPRLCDNWSEITRGYGYAAHGTSFGLTLPDVNRMIAYALEQRLYVRQSRVPAGNARGRMGVGPCSAPAVDGCLPAPSPPSGSALCRYARFVSRSLEPDRTPVGATTRLGCLLRDSGWTGRNLRLDITTAAIERLKQPYGFRGPALEKALRLLYLLQSIYQRAYGRDNFALRGGMALPMFYLNLKRLAVDIDLAYTGRQEPPVYTSIGGGIHPNIYNVLLAMRFLAILT